ncbi:hypothetical protein BDV18DRAFT_166876 [Aspergillus unguis]
MAAALQFDGQTAVVTGAGSALGKECAIFLASRGANVVVNDQNNSSAADLVVKQITAQGGKAVASYHNVQDGAGIIETALRTYGRVDIIINNPIMPSAVSFGDMTDQQWDDTITSQIRGAYRTTQPAWSHFRKQRYGRVILFSPAGSVEGRAGQCHGSAAAAGMIGFGETLAKEGEKYNIRTNIVAAPADGSSSSAVVALLAVLLHSKNTFSNGSIFEVDGGRVSKLRWERSSGALLRCDGSMTPGAVLNKWAAVNDFSNPEYPNTTADLISKLKVAQQLPPNETSGEVRFDGRVAVVTGGGAGLGRSYCLQLAKLGAAVVVNDLANPDSVVQEIRAMGGTAVPSKVSVEDGDSVIKTAIDNFGRVDILINNAGILRDKAFQNISPKMWDDINSVHLWATYKCSRAAYPYMVKQKFGRIVNTTSTSGIYGNFGQANYAAAKTAIIGLSQALALEGRQHNIQVNCISPSAGTQLTASVLSEEALKSRKPEYVAAIVVLLCSDRAPSTATGQIFEAGCGWQARTRLQRSSGVQIATNGPPSPESLLGQWQAITGFPKDWTRAIEAAKAEKPCVSRMTFTDKDSILYNLSLGAQASDLPLVYEGDKNFQLLPSFGVIPGTTAKRSFKLDELVPNFSPKMLLHGEHYLEVRKYPVATSGTLESHCKLVDIFDKGKASVAVIGTLTKDAATGEELYYNECSLFLRGSGGFGGRKTDASAVHKTPERSADRTVEEKTSIDQAALYRLNGDRNPLHIDPAVSQAGGFEAPILHGLCSFGITTKHIFTQYGPIKSIKTRFTGTVTPGQTLVTEMWQDGQVVSFQTRVKETGRLCISGGVARLVGGPSARL